MRDVSSKAIFFSESIECFRGIAYRFIYKLFITIPVAAIIIGIIVHFRFYIYFISILKLMFILLLLLLLLLLLSSSSSSAAIELSLGGSSPYTRTDTKQIRINVYELNSTKNTVLAIKNIVNTSTHTHITKTPTRTHTHTLHKLKQTVQDPNEIVTI
jgi:hypothetical protein